MRGGTLRWTQKDGLVRVFDVLPSCSPMTPYQIKRAMGQHKCKGHGNYARGLAEIPMSGSYATGYKR